MKTEIAQIVALTCHANAFLAGREVGEFFSGNSTCRFCNRVSFVKREKKMFRKQTEEEVASTPNEWFEYIRTQGTSGVRLGRVPRNDPRISDRMSAGLVGGGGIWCMEALPPGNRGEYWTPHWQVWTKFGLGDRRWRVTYTRVFSSARRDIPPLDLEGTIFQLARSLREIQSFATDRGLEHFAAVFADALVILESEGKSLPGYHQDLAPEGFRSREAEIILHACQKAWVFGAMGSWNDVWFDGEGRDEYEAVSEDLYQNLCAAICAAANSTCCERDSLRT